MALLYRMGTGNGSGGDLKPFIVNFTCHSGFIGKTVTMEFQGTPHAGETVDNVSGTVASDGTLTLYPMHDGLWKYYATSDVSGYHEETITLEKWGNYPVELVDAPNGATVTPTDDVQTWLHCANIWNKSYTTISEVVADTTTLNTLINDNNAVDYMVRSTTWVSDVCNNESAMTYIGLNKYCANILLNDDNWFASICESEYFEKVLDISVPQIQSDTSKVDQSSFYDTTTKGFRVFDKNDLTIWNTADNDTSNQWVQYEFDTPIVVNKVFMKAITDTKWNQYTGFPKQFKIFGVDDVGEHEVYSGENPSTSSGVEYTYNFKNDTPYKKYKLVAISNFGLRYVIMARLQFYGHLLA